MPPLMSVTIRPDDAQPSPLQSLKMTIELDVVLHCRSGAEFIVPHLGHFLSRDTYDDGRHSLPQELLTHAVSLMLRDAAWHAAFKHFQALYGIETVPYANSGCEGQQLRAYAEANLWMDTELRGILASLDGGLKISVEPVEEPK